MNLSDCKTINDMTPREALKQITSGRKWYAVRPEPEHQVKMRVTALRILNGTAKPETMQEFFAEFGYRMKFDISIEKAS